MLFSVVNIVHVYLFKSADLTCKSTKKISIKLQIGCCLSTIIIIPFFFLKIGRDSKKFGKLSSISKT